MRLRGKCTLSDGNEVPMPSTGTSFEQHMLQVEPVWVALGKMLPGVEHVSVPGVGQGHSLSERSAAALKLIRNHEAVIRDVCNPLQMNVVGAPLTQTHLQRLPVQYVQYVEEALRMVAIKLLGVGTSANGLAPRLDPNNKAQVQVWAATSMFVLARLHVRDGRANPASRLMFGMDVLRQL